MKGGEGSRQGESFSAAEPEGKRELGDPKHFSMVALQRPVLPNAQNNVRKFYIHKRK